jgi:hypothetical protein
LFFKLSENSPAIYGWVKRSTYFTSPVRDERIALSSLTGFIHLRGFAPSLERLGYCHAAKKSGLVFTNPAGSPAGFFLCGVASGLWPDWNCFVEMIFH